MISLDDILAKNPKWTSRNKQLSLHKVTNIWEAFESNGVVAAFNEDELEKNKDEQGNETIILSTYDGKETVGKDREDSEDLDESTAEVLIVACRHLVEITKTHNEER